MFSYLGWMSSIGVDRKILTVVGLQIIFHIWQKLCSERHLDYVKSSLEKLLSVRGTPTVIFLNGVQCCRVLKLFLASPIVIFGRSHCPKPWRPPENSKGWLWALRNLELHEVCSGMKRSLTISISHFGQKSDLSIWKQINRRAINNSKFLLPSRGWLC